MNLSTCLLGHKRRIFDIRCHVVDDVPSSIPHHASATASDEKASSKDKWLLTASEDGTAKLWYMPKKRPVFSFDHNREAEVLRVAFVDGINLIATCGADGKCKLWKKCAGSLKYSITRVLDHGDTQIYACEPVGGRLMTAVDDRLYLWNLTMGDKDIDAKPHTWSFINVDVNGSNKSKKGGNAQPSNYGGPRNAEKMAYIFDAKAHSMPLTSACYDKPDSILVALALSDGTVRFLSIDSSTYTSTSSAATEQTMPFDSSNCFILSQLIKDWLESDDDEGFVQSLTASHVTAVSWSPDIKILVASLGNGHVAVLDVHRVENAANISNNDSTKVSLRGLLTWHKSSSYGTYFLPTSVQRKRSHDGQLCAEEMQILTWSSDCHLCVWKGPLQGLCTVPSTFFHIKEYPIYACTTVVNGGGVEVYCAGGGSKQQFMGNPVHLLFLEC